MKPQSRILLIDCQLLQTTAWDRGMGKYTRGFLKELARRQKIYEEIVFLFNKNLEFADYRKEELANIGGVSEFVYIDLPTNLSLSSHARSISKDNLNDFISDEKYKNSEVDFLITGLFMFDYCSAFPNVTGRKLLLFYDLIPLIEWEYFSQLFPADIYFDHFNSVLEADSIFSISKTVKAQLEEILGVNSDKITVVDGSFSRRNIPQKATNIEAGRYVMLPTADLPHKNNINAVRAFATFNRQFGDAFTLVVTSTIAPHCQEELNSYSEHILFVGNVSDDVYDSYLQGCEFLLLPSKIEGLGLPVLEAVAANKKVVCSSISAFKEISSNAFYFCSPEDYQDIAIAMTDAITSRNWGDKQKQYKKILKRYTWTHSAERFLDRIKQMKKASKTTPTEELTVVASVTSLDKINYQAWLPTFSESWKVNYFVDTRLESPSPLFIKYLSNFRHLQDVKVQYLLKKSYRTIYIIDGSGKDDEVYKWASLCPGICIVLTSNITETAETLTKRLNLAEMLETEKSANKKKYHKRVAGISTLKLQENIITSQKISDKLSEFGIKTEVTNIDEAKPYIIAQFLGANDEHV